MNTQLTRHERSDLSLGFGKNEPAHTLWATLQELKPR